MAISDNAEQASIEFQDFANWEVRLMAHPFNAGEMVIRWGAIVVNLKDIGKVLSFALLSGYEPFVMQMQQMISIRTDQLAIRREDSILDTIDLVEQDVILGDVEAAMGRLQQLLDKEKKV